MNNPIADYLEDLAAKVRAGTHTVEVEKTEFEKSVVVEFYEGAMYEVPGDVDDSQYREVLRITKVGSRNLC